MAKQKPKKSENHFQDMVIGGLSCISKQLDELNKVSGGSNVILQDILKELQEIKNLSKSYDNYIR